MIKITANQRESPEGPNPSVPVGGASATLNMFVCDEDTWWEVMVVYVLTHTQVETPPPVPAIVIATLL